MSYDLFLKPRSGHRLGAAEFDRYFASRANYTLQSGQAWYENDDTGVYFSFDLSDPSEDEVDCWAAFNLNFLRPHFFALEALPELEALVAEFSLVVEDPQVGGMGQGDFVGSLFVSGWSDGNSKACAAAGQAGVERPAALSTARLEAIWSWNFAREELEARFDDSLFVPKIMFLREDASPNTATVWTDAIPAVLPETDVVMLYREVTAPRRFLRKRSDLALARWDEIAPLLQEFPRAEDPIPYYTLDYESPPEPLLSFFKGQPALSENPIGLPPDQVLNAETLEAANA